MTVAELIQYYVNLLIIQYHNQPKAQATIALYVEEILANNILQDIQNAYDVNTAVGKQLDVIGKYVGIDRYYSGLNLIDFFSLVEYDESLPSPPDRAGFSDYSDFSDYAYNGTLEYDEIITTTNALTDDVFRTLIKMKIIINTINFSHSSIDTLFWDFFGAAIRPESNGNMHMWYFVNAPTPAIVGALLAKGLLIHPIGVGVGLVEDIFEDMFALTSYSDIPTPYGFGFSDYADYATLPGQVLTYDQLSEV